MGLRASVTRRAKWQRRITWHKAGSAYELHQDALGTWIVVATLEPDRRVAGAFFELKDAKRAVERLDRAASELETEGSERAAPRGFVAAYGRVARAPATPAALSDLLGLVGYRAAANEIVVWPIAYRVEAQVYAANAHLRASDNSIQRCPRPDWFPEPWQGKPLDLTGEEQAVFEPQPTPLVCPAVAELLERVRAKSLEHEPRSDAEERS